ncbi:MAG: hypothetical protein ACREE6_04805 [Limisphaerales bacterium]
MPASTADEPLNELRFRDDLNKALPYVTSGPIANNADLRKTSAILRKVVWGE